MPPPRLRPHYTMELPSTRKQLFLSQYVKNPSYTDVRNAPSQENSI